MANKNRKRIDDFVSICSSFDIVDLSHPLEEQMPIWPGLSKYYHTLWFSIHYGDAATAYQLVMSEHTGTHVDAPGHYVPSGYPNHKWVDQVDLENWMGRAALIDCRDIKPRSEVPARKVIDWERSNGKLRTGDIAVFNFGWYEKWATRPDDTEFLKNWPGLGPECIEILIDRGIKAVGVDTLSPDIYASEGDPVHHTLLGEGIMIIENLANLRLPSPLFYLISLPLKIRGGSGSPVRALALVPK
ncbi:cyclase family protein [Rubrobacter naiadicus]|uniref:cyclase family protein n=1 Tax=Rubrobacter naiadicus TaxID=1392641 RepID=UPI00235E5333|nr:cyclase family protein [Rubrobacter naiadicus]